MKKIEKFLQKFLVPVANYLNRNKVVIALRDGMVMTLPLVLFGSFSLIISYFPYLDQIAPDLALWLQNFFAQANAATMGIMALLVLVGVSSSYARELKVDRIYGVLTALGSFMMVTIFSATGTVNVNGEEITDAVMNNVIPVDVLGSMGIFTAIIVAILSVRIFAYIHSKDLTIKMPDSVPPNVANSFSALIPVMITLFVFLVIRNVMLATQFGSIQEMIYTLITTPLLRLGNNIVAYSLLIIVQQLLWFFGIHGTSILSAVWGPVSDTMMAANLEAYTAGEPLPYILSTPFGTVYGQGGAQGILPAVIAAFAVMKSKQTKMVAKLSIAPATFNIQEPFHFGLPSFMNPILLIPYVLVTVVQIWIAYGLCYVGIAPVPIFPVPWTTPIILSGFLATGSIMGAVTQLIQLVVGVLIWIPFIRLVDKDYYILEQGEKVKGE